MKAKTGRFNYLINGETSTDRNEEAQRFEYKEIIRKLSREHQTKNIEHLFPIERSPQRTYSPIGHVVEMKPSQNNHEIRSIILNEQLTPIKKQEPKSKIDAYRIIKDSHLMSDQEMKQFQQKDSSKKVYYSPFKQHKPPEHQPTVIKFYQVKADPQSRDGKKVNAVKNNQPYINQPIQCYEQQHNPQLKRTTPPKMGEMKMSRTKSNKAYKVAIQPEPAMPKYQEPFYYFPQRQGTKDRPEYPLKEHNLKEKLRKRSCYDYVPEQMKARLRRQHQY